MTLQPGTKLGRYEIRSQLGAGGMGEVYRARDEKLNRDVAIKVLPASLSESEDRLRRFVTAHCFLTYIAGAGLVMRKFRSRH